MRKWIVAMLTIVIILLLLTTIVASFLYGFVDNYKLELWVFLLIYFVKVINDILPKQKKDNKIIIPKDAININVTGISVPSEGKNSNSIDPEFLINPEIEVDKSNIKAWKDIDVGETSLKGEDYKPGE